MAYSWAAPGLMLSGFSMFSSCTKLMAEVCCGLKKAEKGNLGPEKGNLGPHLGRWVWRMAGCIPKAEKGLLGSVLYKELFLLLCP